MRTVVRNLEGNLSVCSEKAELINEMTEENKVSQGKVRALSTVFGVSAGGGVVGLPVNHNERTCFFGGHLKWISVH